MNNNKLKELRIKDSKNLLTKLTSVSSSQNLSFLISALFINKSMRPKVSLVVLNDSKTGRRKYLADSNIDFSHLRTANSQSHRNDRKWRGFCRTVAVILHNNIRRHQSQDQIWKSEKNTRQNGYWTRFHFQRDFFISQKLLVSRVVHKRLDLIPLHQ